MIEEEPALQAKLVFTLSSSSSLFHLTSMTVHQESWRKKLDL